MGKYKISFFIIFRRVEVLLEQNRNIFYEFHNEKEGKRKEKERKTQEKRKKKEEMKKEEKKTTSKAKGFRSLFRRK